jgi:putative spermidine/putrescine transport system permease protein
MISADGMPLKKSLARALRRQKLRALMLIAPLLIFVVMTFIIPIGSMLFRSVENEIVSNTLPQTIANLDEWSGEEGTAPGEALFRILYMDMYRAVEAKAHTRLGSRLNYEQSGISSLFRTTGRGLEDIGEDFEDFFKDRDPDMVKGPFWHELMGGTGGEALVRERRRLWVELTGEDMSGDAGFGISAETAELLPWATRAYTDWALYTALIDDDVVAEEKPWPGVYAALAIDLADTETQAALAAYNGPGAAPLQAALAGLAEMPPTEFRTYFEDINEDWTATSTWTLVRVFASKFTSGYFLNAVDMKLGLDGVESRPDNQRLYVKLFNRTIFMSIVITVSCIILGYPVAWLLANLSLRTANVLMILVLLPFWTSLLVRTSAWKVLLQQQGVINEILVWLGFVDDANRLVMMNNSTGTIIAMTHILLPFMILPLYSVMKSIPLTYLRAAKSLGATNWTAFWRVYFPQSVPGIGAGSILVFILAIGYYITPEIVGGTDGVFISNRIAYHISSSLNWGLAAALGTILLALVLILYWLYDRIVGIDNVKLGG